MRLNRITLIELWSKILHKIWANLVNLQQLTPKCFQFMWLKRMKPNLQTTMLYQFSKVGHCDIFAKCSKYPHRVAEKWMAQIREIHAEGILTALLIALCRIFTALCQSEVSMPVVNVYLRNQGSLPRKCNQ